MPETSGRIAGLDWPALVAEAVRRRKAEKLTQKQHAALAGVSIPTIIAFDRGERTLSLAKAIDILRIVGLVEEVPAEHSQDAFVREAFARWRDSPDHFPYGWYRVDYAIEGDLRDVGLHGLRDLMAEAIVPHTLRPMFRWNEAPRETGGFLDYRAEGVFWRASPAGRMFLIRSYQEDAQETFPPGTIFDVTLPIWRIAEALLHASRLTKLIARNPESAKVRMRILYTGLRGRDLRAWASPGTMFFGGGRSRSDEVMVENTIPATEIASGLTRHVLTFLEPLYERFGVTGTAPGFVDAQLDQMLGQDFSKES